MTQFSATSSRTCSARSSCNPWTRSPPIITLLAIVLLAVFSTTPVHAQSSGSDFFYNPNKNTEWHLGDTVQIKFSRALSQKDSNNTMLYLEYTTRACQGSRPDDERYCDNRATKVTAFGQLPFGADSHRWTIPTTLDLQLSRGKFHLYDYNGHTSESFTILPAPRRQPYRSPGMIYMGDRA
ncbi:hypothetical protein EMPS_07239 [Entomortierella parvispora]|uniref:Uncharacterized protein n=1 Tax=Entomortierella parvispora TaxID=205924 RepID=A0A9P3HE17_9FUNG|nr:hypothetical protein EMPS_07239 [Entomortierella parvispora]